MIILTKIEDIKNNSAKVVSLIADWMGIKNDKSLYEIEFLGKKFNQSSFDLETTSEFKSSEITTPIGRVFGEKDIKILETLFWPFMSLYNYTELREDEFLKNLKIIKPWLDEPFQFEIDIHNQLPDDKPEIKDIMPLNEFRKNLKSFWEILNSNKTYLSIVKPL